MSSLRGHLFYIGSYKENSANVWANQSQILVDIGNKSLFAASGSLDQDGHHAHIW